VREELDPFVYAYLKAMGRRVGVEVSVNTSLNVGSPMAQTPEQALQVVKRSKGMSGLIMIGAEGDAFLAWHNVRVHPRMPANGCSNGSADGRWRSRMKPAPFGGPCFS